MLHLGACYQDIWQTACSVWKHHPGLMNQVTGCILSSINTPSMMTMIGQPQNETPSAYLPKQHVH